MNTAGSTSASALDAVFNPRSLAVLGASEDPQRTGGRPIDGCRRGGFAAAIYPIHRTHGTIQGLPAYPSLEAVPGAVDLCVIALPGEAVPQAVDACIARGARAIVVFSAGFAETGAPGEAVQEAMRQRCAAAGVRLVGPNCLGVMNVGAGLFCTFATNLDSAWPKRGTVSMVCQSGAIGAYAMSLAAERGIGFAKWIATGNEADVEAAECAAWLADDPDTAVIMVYLEGCRDGTLLRRALARARANRKAVIVLKAGASDIGAAAVASHTGTLAGADAVWDAILAEGGAHRARTIGEFVDMAYACAGGLFPRDNHLAVVTVSGGAGALMADTAATLGLELPVLPDEAQARIRAIVPYAAPANPVDVTGQIIRLYHELDRFIDIVVERGQYGSLIVFMAHQGKAPKLFDQFKPALWKVRERYPQLLLVFCGTWSAEARLELESHGFLLFEDPARAVAAVAALATFAGTFARPPGLADTVRASQRASLGIPPGPLDEARSKGLLAQAGVPFAPERVVRSAAGARAAADELGYPVALKVLSGDIPHKSDAGGVALGLADGDAVALAWERMMAAVQQAAPGATIDGALVAPMIQGGVETVLGFIRDPVFGPVVMFGLGGVFVEVFRDVSFRPAPLGRAAAHAMIRELKGYPLLAGARGRAPVDLERLVDALVALGDFGAANADSVSSVDINPFIALPAGGVAVDALIVR